MTSTSTQTAAHEIEQCRSCDARIIWAITAAGRRMPVDAEPGRDGSVRLTARDGMLPLAEVLPVAKRFGKTQLHTSHFATCPQADRWRTRKLGRR